MSSENNKLNNFISYLNKISEYDDKFYYFKRIFSNVSNAWPVIGEYLSPNRSSDQNYAFYIPAGAIGLGIKKTDKNIGFGVSLRKLSDAMGKNDSSRETFIRRLSYYSNRKELFLLMLTLLTLMRNYDIPINIENFCKDLYYWNEDVLFKWNYEYWNYV